MSTRGSEATAVPVRATLPSIMASRQMAWTDWLKRVTRAPLASQTGNYVGYPVDAVADRLCVSRQRVHQLIQQGDLDTIEILTTKGKLSMVLVTETSLEKYEPVAVGSNQFVTRHA